MLNGSMRHTISSGQTFFMKFVFPAVWLTGFAAVTVALFTGGRITNPDGLPPPTEMKWLFFGATVIGGLFLFWCCMRLKRVELDDDSLHISNYLREVRVPLRDIEEITENRWINIRPVTLEFRRDTEFGPRITFMPKTRWWGFWRAHPVVGELEAAARRSRGLPPERPPA
jgi:hypothetical protein